MTWRIRTGQGHKIIARGDYPHILDAFYRFTVHYGLGDLVCEREPADDQRPVRLPAGVRA